MSWNCLSVILGYWTVNLNWNCSVETGIFLFRAIQNQGRSGRMRDLESFYYNTTSDCLETAWVSSWGIGLSIWIEIVLWKQGFSFKAIQITDRQVEYDIWRAFIMELNIRLSWNCLSVILGVLDCQSELKLFCGNRDFYFRAIQITDRRWNMNLESFYYLIQHQIVLKLLECHPGVVDCQSELKLICGTGTFIFRAIQNHRQKRWNMIFGALLWNKHQIVWNCLRFILG